MDRKDAGPEGGTRDDGGDTPFVCPQSSYATGDNPETLMHDGRTRRFNVSPGAKGTLALWKEINGCTGEPEQSLEYCETYDTCDAGVEVTLCSLPRTGHILYDNALGFDVAEVAWAMFERQTLP